MLLDSGKVFTGGHAVPDDVEESTLRAAVKDAVEQANGDAQLATQYLEATVRADRRLRDELTESLIREGCYRQVSAVICGQRKAVWTAPNRDPAGAARRTEAVANSTLRGLYQFPLPGGKPLGLALRSEVTDASTFFVTQGKDMTRKGKWLGLVAKAMKSESASVMEQVSLTEIDALQARVVGNA